MSPEAQPVEGITITHAGERVIVQIGDATWEGGPREAERLLTRLHYVLNRARPGTNIASVFLNGTLWGGKFIEADPSLAIEDMRVLIEQLERRVASLQAPPDNPGPT